jgi:hypothetical protein
MGRIDLQLTGLFVVGRLVVHQGLRAATVQKVDGHSSVAAAVRRLEVSIEIWQEVDLVAVELSFGEDTWDLDAGIDLGV